MQLFLVGRASLWDWPAQFGVLQNRYTPQCRYPHVHVCLICVCVVLLSIAVNVFGMQFAARWMIVVYDEDLWIFLVPGRSVSSRNKSESCFAIPGHKARQMERPTGLSGFRIASAFLMQLYRAMELVESATGFLRTSNF